MTLTRLPLFLPRCSIQGYTRTHKPGTSLLETKTMTCREAPEKLYEGLNETEMVRQHGSSIPLSPSSQLHPL